MSKPTFNIANPIYIVNKSSDVDSRYGPWSSIADANTNVDINIRDIGLTVGVSAVGVGVTEYWYKNGIQNTDLVLKTTGGGGGGADLSVFNTISSQWTSSTSTVCSLSSNWNSVYSFVNTNSSFWNYTNVVTTFPLSSNGASIINVLSGNVFYLDDIFNGRIFGYSNFDIGKTIILYLSTFSSEEELLQFPIGTYFNNVGDSNYLLVVPNKLTKATISNINNKYYGSAEIYDFSNPRQTLVFQTCLRMDGILGFLLQEDGDRLVWDNTPTTLPPP